MYLLQAHVFKLNTQKKAVIHRQQKLTASLGRYFLLVTNCLFLVTRSNKFPSIFSGHVARRGSLWHCASLRSTSVLLYRCNLGNSLESLKVSFRVILKESTT